MEQRKINPNNGLRALIDELYSRVALAQSMVSGVVSNAIIFRPGGVTSGVVTTWTAVQQAISKANGVLDMLARTPARSWT